MTVDKKVDISFIDGLIDEKNAEIKRLTIVINEAKLRNNQKYIIYRALKNYANKLQSELEEKNGDASIETHNRECEIMREVFANESIIEEIEEILTKLEVIT